MLHGMQEPPIASLIIGGVIWLVCVYFIFRRPVIHWPLGRARGYIGDGAPGADACGHGDGGGGDSGCGGGGDGGGGGH